MKNCPHDKDYARYEEMGATSPRPNGFPSPPRVSFPQRELSLPERWSPFHGGEGERGGGFERCVGAVGDLRNKMGVEDVSPTIALTLTLSRGERGQLRAGRFDRR